MALLARAASPLSVPSLRLSRSPRFSVRRRSILGALPCAFPSAAAGSCCSEAGADAVSAGQRVLLKGMEFSELERWVQGHGYRSGQALMLWKLLYGNNTWAHCTDELIDLTSDALERQRSRTEPGDITRSQTMQSSDVMVEAIGLNKDFKKMLSENAIFKMLSVKNILTSSDGTRKILFTLGDGSVIETVVIPFGRGRTTICVSSQVGCAMNCQFCYTGRMGLKRHLTAAEIVEQAVFAQRLLSSEFGSITNVVFMGMGEPLHNVDNVIKAAAIMVDEQGLHFSPRKVTVSTSGLVPQLKRFLKESNCALAVSLNATTDEVRNWIMPINRKYNLAQLLGTLREELSFKHRYKVLFEYVMLEGVNDSLEDAERLIELVKGIPCKINLIKFNPHEGSMFRPTLEEKMIKFRNILVDAECVVFLRFSKGDDQMAACGQLGELGEFRAPLLRVPLQFQAAVQ